MITVKKKKEDKELTPGCLRWKTFAAGSTEITTVVIPVHSVFRIDTRSKEDPQTKTRVPLSFITLRHTTFDLFIEAPIIVIKVTHGTFAMSHSFLLLSPFLPPRHRSLAYWAIRNARIPDWIKLENKPYLSVPLCISDKKICSCN